MPQSKLFTSLAGMFKPPFYGLGALTWLYFVWAFMVFPHSGILRGNLPDPDDYMYLTQVLDWLKGQSWFDTTQYRLNPPWGVPIHFSRIADLPLAALILPLHKLGLPWIGAATVAALIWPLLILAGFINAIRWVAEEFVPRDWARVTAYVAVFMPDLMFQFTPGHVDHHGLVGVITLLGFGCIVRMMREPHIVKWGLGAGFMLALGQVIALETLPWLLLLAAWVGVWMIIKGREAARSGLAFGLMLYIASAAFLAVTKTPAVWFEPDMLAYSVVYVLLVAAMAVCFTGVALVAQTRFTILRYVTGIVLAVVAAILFFDRFPELLHGPYGAMDKQLEKLMFDNIMEAAPLWQSAGSWPMTILRLALPLLALVANLNFLDRAEGSKAWGWFLSFLVLFTAILLATFYQVRLMIYVFLFSIIPLAAFLRQGLAWSATRWRGRQLAAAELGLILLVGPLLTVFGLALVDNRAFNTGVLLFPVLAQDDRCDMAVLEHVLTMPQYYGDHPRVIMNLIDQGSELLFRTPHKVLSAPYHENVAGNLDAVKFFSTTDPAVAESIARAHKVDLVVMCRLVPGLYLGKGPGQIELNEDGKVAPKADASFAEQLIYDKQPAWLTRKKFPMLKNYLLFEMKPAGKKDDAGAAKPD